MTDPDRTKIKPMKSTRTSLTSNAKQLENSGSFFQVPDIPEETESK